MKRIAFFVTAIVLCGAASARAQNAGELYREGLHAARTGQQEFAFMNYHSIVAQEKASKYRDEALFGCGEYYFGGKSYQEAQRMFTAYVTEYPMGRGVPFALAYLYKLTDEFGMPGDLNALKKQLITYAQLSLVFREFKEFAFRSPMNTPYSARYYIDRIEMSRQGEALAAIRF